jgi:hypothetical protein
MTTAWIQTHSGKAFDLFSPRPEQVDVTDIAHSLGMQCRYNGHCNRFYSVAEHSVIMAHMVPGELEIHALLHDAAEAYVSDIVRPLKQHWPAFAVMERQVLAVIYEHLGVAEPTVEQRAAIERADLRMLRTERDQLLSPPPEPWGGGVEDVEPWPVLLLPSPWGPAEAKERWGTALAETLMETPTCSPRCRLALTYLPQAVMRQVYDCHVACILTDFDKQLKELRGQRGTEENDAR